MITNKTEYLLMILMDLYRHQDEGYVLTRDVAERQGIPANYVPQLMAILTKKGWVDSVRGAGGGVHIVVAPKKVTVKDVLQVAEDPIVIKACLLDAHRCPKQKECPLHPVWERAQASVDAIMASTTLADLLKSSKQ